MITLLSCYSVDKLKIIRCGHQRQCNGGRKPRQGALYALTLGFSRLCAACPMLSERESQSLPNRRFPSLPIRMQPSLPIRMHVRCNTEVFSLRRADGCLKNGALLTAAGNILYTYIHGFALVGGRIRVPVADLRLSPHAMRHRHVHAHHGLHTCRRECHLCPWQGGWRLLHGRRIACGVCQWRWSVRLVRDPRRQQARKERQRERPDHRRSLSRRHPHAARH